MAEDMGDKTEAPTGKRLSDARQKGQVAKSQDLAAAAQLVAACFLVYWFGKPLMEGMGNSVRYGLDMTDGGKIYEASSVQESLVWMTINGMWAAFPVLGLVAVATYLVNAGQTGFIFTLDALAPDLSRLNPMAGLQRMFGASNAGRNGAAFVKMMLVFVVGSSYVWKLLPRIAALPTLSMAAGLKQVGGMTMDLIIWMLLILVLVGVVDYLFQRWTFMRSLRMTKQEVKDERKDMDGDPEIKGKRRQRARQIAMQRINRDVPKADVIVTNPTHFAVALQYDSMTMPAPRVVAKGADLLALRIRQVASANGIPIVERPPLARAIYFGAEVGEEISPEHYHAVAEILAYVYRLEKQAA